MMMGRKLLNPINRHILTSLVHISSFSMLYSYGPLDLRKFYQDLVWNFGLGCSLLETHQLRATPHF